MIKEAAAFFFQCDRFLRNEAKTPYLGDNSYFQTFLIRAV